MRIKTCRMNARLMRKMLKISGYNLEQLSDMVGINVAHRELKSVSSTKLTQHQKESLRSFYTLCCMIENSNITKEILRIND